MPETLVDLYSKRHPETEEPFIGDCTLITGDGTEKVEFRKGHAKAPRDVAERLVAARSDLSLGQVGTGDPLDALTPEEREAVLAVRRQSGVAPSTPAGQQPLPPEGPVSRAADNQEDDGLAKAPPPAPDAAGSSVPVADLSPEEQDRLAAAREHLEAEGEEVPVADAGEGLVAKTAEGEPRCQALTTTGKQCSNVAVDGPGCRLAPHRAQLGVADEGDESS